MTITPPIINFVQLDTSELQDPTGRRNLLGGYFAFDRLVSLGCMHEDPLRPSSTSGTFQFRDVTFDTGNLTSQIASKVECLIIRMQTSGVGIASLRLYLNSQTALTQPAADRGLDPAFVQFTASGIWQPNSVLPSGAGTRLSTTVPTNPNVFRSDGHTALLNNNDDNTSQFIYMNLIVPLGFPLGSFGVCGSGLLRYNFSYDYFSNDYLLPPGSV